MARRLGVETVRGSGTHSPDFDKKGGTSAFREMLTALDQGYSVAITADVPKVARVCGLGIVKLASMSGRAIYPVAIATSPRRVLNNWDRSVVPLRSAAAPGSPALVRAPDADAAALRPRGALEGAQHGYRGCSRRRQTRRPRRVADGAGDAARYRADDGGALARCCFHRTGAGHAVLPEQAAKRSCVPRGADAAAPRRRDQRRAALIERIRARDLGVPSLRHRDLRGTRREAVAARRDHQFARR